MAEGVVVRPRQTILLQTGKTVERALVKIKAPQFAEIAATAGAAAGDPRLLAARAAVNANRLAAVLSKIGRLSAKNAGRVEAALVEDALESLAEQHPGAGTDPRVRREVQTAAAATVRSALK